MHRLSTAWDRVYMPTIPGKEMDAIIFKLQHEPPERHKHILHSREHQKNPDRPKQEDITSSGRAERTAPWEEKEAP